MPGPFPEYINNPRTREAEILIDEGIKRGADGAAIIQTLADAEFRVYAEDEIEELTGEEYGEGEEEMAPGPPISEPEPGLGEEEGESPLSPHSLGEGPGPSMVGGPEGGGRDALIIAVRGAMEKDKENKKSRGKSAE